MYTNKEARFANALLVFYKAWEELAASSKACPDLDVSDFYPFYLLNFEEIAPAVRQWSLVHASRILNNLPDRVPNPACVQRRCPYLMQGVDQQSGLCKGWEHVKCGLYPLTMFDAVAASMLLRNEGVDTAGLNPENVQLLYTRKVDEIYEKTQQMREGS